MNRMDSVFLRCVLFTLLLSVSSLVSADWTRVGEARAGGDAKEFSISGRADTVRIICLEGTVIINTLVVREGGEREHFPVTRRLNAGESVDVPLNRQRNITGFRISDGGRGRYEVQMRAEPEAAPIPRQRDRFRQVAQLAAGGNAKEVSLTDPVRAIRIQSVSDTVIINTVVIRDGAARRAVPVTRRLSQGEYFDVPLNPGENVTGLRISDGGNGQYHVLVR
jgi:hypothetical protein